MSTQPPIVIKPRVPLVAGFPSTPRRPRPSKTAVEVAASVLRECELLEEHTSEADSLAMSVIIALRKNGFLA